MSDYSLMNPDHLSKEIEDLQELIDRHEAEAQKMLTDLERIIEYVAATHNRQEPTTLTHDQVADLLGVLGTVTTNLYRYNSHEKFSLKVYNYLRKDRRYRIATTLLRFLKN